MAKKDKEVGIDKSSMAGGLMHLPINPRWISEHPCFLSNEPALVRACFSMIAAAWRNFPDVSIPASYPALGHITGLSEVQIGSAFRDLAHGWELRDGRLVHVELQVLGDRMWERHAETFEQITVDAAAIMQAPEDFDLTMPEAVSSRTKGRKLLPPAWSPSTASIARLIGMGYSEQSHRDALVSKMRDWANSTDQKKTNWDATLMVFASREPRPSFGLSSLPGVPVGGRFGGLINRGEAAKANNSAAMEQARQRSRFGGDA